MKTLTLLISLTLCALVTNSQNIHPGQMLSIQIAKRMKDTLGLSDLQYRSIYQANLNLLNQKTAVRQLHTKMDSLRVYIQRIENGRDLLYQPVLTPGQYLAYKQKKIRLISAQ